MKLLWRMVILSFFFWQILAKTCSIMVSRGVCMGMAGRGDFSRICFFFPQGICTFFVSCFYAGEKMLLFFDVIFCFFTRVSFKKQQKKLNPHSKVKWKLIYVFSQHFLIKCWFKLLPMYILLWVYRVGG